MSYLNSAHMGNYRQALAEMPVDPDVTQTRATRVKYGFGLNFDQELSDDLGLFGRLGWDDGQEETWAFTEIDATASLGLVLRGAPAPAWGSDRAGVRGQRIIGLRIRTIWLPADWGSFSATGS